MNPALLNRDEQTLLEGALTNVNKLISEGKYQLHADLTLIPLASSQAQPMCGGSCYFHLHWYGYEGALDESMV